MIHTARRARSSHPQQRAGAVRVRPGALLLAVLLAGGGTLAGCKLVDQRTFDHNANRKPVPKLPPAPPAAKPLPPLALVRFGTPPESWQPELSAIVRQALQRKPDAVFTVQTVVPGIGTAEQQTAAIQNAVRDGGVPVAQTIQDAGATGAQINMAATTDAVSAPEIRVTVR